MGDLSYIPHINKEKYKMRKSEYMKEYYKWGSFHVFYVRGKLLFLRGEIRLRCKINFE